jgi:plastocyanin
MISRVLGAAVLVAGVTLVSPAPAPAAPASAARVNATVTVANMAFTPKTVKVSVGGSVTWNFPSTPAHTSTSTQGFWDSGARASGASFSRTFTSAGAYPYHCTIHAIMRGLVNVPVKVTGSPTAGWTLRWSTVAGAGSTTFDAQVRKPGTTAWKPLKTDTTLASVTYNPSKVGKYAVRARTHDGADTSSWSPAKLFKIA